MTELIKDVAGLSAPLTKLFEVVSNCIGTLYEPTRIRKKAKAEKDAMLIMAEADIEKRALTDRAASRIYTQELRRQGNIESIVEKCLKEMPETVSPEPPDPDWVSDFFEGCKDVSNVEVQKFWARLLAREVSTPGVIGRRALSILRQMGHREAVSFEQVCSLRWARGECSVFLLRDGLVDVHEEMLFPVPLEIIYELDSLGLISVGMDQGEYLAQAPLADLLFKSDPSQGKLTYFGREVPAVGDDRPAIPMPVVPFTRPGKELADTLDSEPNWKYFDRMVEEMAARGYISRAK